MIICNELFLATPSMNLNFTFREVNRCQFSLYSLRFVTQSVIIYLFLLLITQGSSLWTAWAVYWLQANTKDLAQYLIFSQTDVKFFCQFVIEVVSINHSSYTGNIVFDNSEYWAKDWYCLHKWEDKGESCNFVYHSVREVAGSEATCTGNDVTEVGYCSSSSPPSPSLALKRAGYPFPAGWTDAVFERSCSEKCWIGPSVTMTLQALCMAPYSAQHYISW